MRQVITAKDIQIYFGKKESMSFKMMSQIKKDLGKQKHQPVSIQDFCEYYKVDKEGIVQIIKNNENEKQNVASKNNIEKKDKVTVKEEVKSKFNQIKPYTFSKPTY
ncbi:hypothetical protein [uncultured Flavobacterium sp.]|uniref:hypothetical protein n=1 Tax=uncultured Flavobacterium sp. TaxID=165435 RepID=UPI0026304391|nr:hypothetical protein [uncultured Flavobacterium sp.]